MGTQNVTYQFFSDGGKSSQEFVRICYALFYDDFLGYMKKDPTEIKEVKFYSRGVSSKQHRKNIFDVIADAFSWYPTIDWDAWEDSYVHNNYPNFIQVKATINPNVLFAIATMTRMAAEEEDVCKLADAAFEKDPSISWWEHFALLHTKGQVPYWNSNHSLFSTPYMGVLRINHKKVSLNQVFSSSPLCDPKIPLAGHDRLGGNLFKIVQPYSEEVTTVGGKNPYRDWHYKVLVEEYKNGYPTLNKEGVVLGPRK